MPQIRSWSVTFFGHRLGPGGAPQDRLRTDPQTRPRKPTTQHLYSVSSPQAARGVAAVSCIMAGTATQTSALWPSIACSRGIEENTRLFIVVFVLEWVWTAGVPAAVAASSVSKASRRNPTRYRVILKEQFEMHVECLRLARACSDSVQPSKEQP